MRIKWKRKLNALDAERSISRKTDSARQIIEDSSRGINARIVCIGSFLTMAFTG